MRITAGPGRREGQVSVTGFNADGWIGADSAALVRVVGSAAEVLVTVYQARDAEGDAPKLQVVRLSAGGMAQADGPAGKGQAKEGRAQAGGTQAGPAKVEVVAHVYARGDVGGTLGEWMGEPGSNRWIEGFGLAPADAVPLSDIEYQAVLGRGWLSPWSEGGQFCGSRGMSLPILGMRVRLKGESAGTHEVAIMASFVDGTRIGPVGDGEACEAASLAALEAFQVVIRAKAAGKAAVKRAAKAVQVPVKGAVPKAEAPKKKPVVAANKPAARGKR